MQPVFACEHLLLLAFTHSVRSTGGGGRSCVAPKDSETSKEQCEEVLRNAERPLLHASFPN